MRTILKYTFLALILVIPAGNARGACTVTTTGANFGSYDTLSTTSLDTTGTISISCTDGAPGIYVVVAVGRSGNSGAFNPRQMKRTTGTDLMNYNMFTNTTRTTIWGDGTSGTSTMTTPQRVRSGRPANMTIYGRIPASQDVSIGTYSDTLVVTITF